MGYAVATPAFEGPVDLLLHLVSVHEVDVLEVPLAPVVEGFVAALAERRQELAVDVVSEFLLVASILVEMKSQRLLPRPDEVDVDEELAGWEERDLLLARLLECRAYAAAADAFVVLAEQASRSVPREVGLDEGFEVHAPDLLTGVSPGRLAQAYLRATAERPEPQVDLSHVTVDAVTVSETVEDLARRLPGQGPTSFRELTRGLRERIEVIVHFLAVLELCKLGLVTLGQGDTFGNLQIAWIAADPQLVGASAGLAVDDYEG